jgi:hypothetical protein
MNDSRPESRRPILKLLTPGFLASELVRFFPLT